MLKRTLPDLARFAVSCRLISRLASACGPEAKSSVPAGFHQAADLGRRGFTLIELVIVLVIAAILSSLAVLSLGGTMDRYQISRASETIEMFDARLRRDAKKSGAILEATIDRRRGRLRVEGDSKTETAVYRIGGGVEIGDVRMHRRNLGGNDFQFDVNREGQSVTYAVQLRRGNMTRWIVILGLSGQVIPMKSEGEVNEILSL